jgi:hypothetical protein
MIMQTEEILKLEGSQVKGWGVDADPSNDPTHPIKKRTDAEDRGYTWDRPPLQRDDVEVLHSNERPDLTAVFGTAAPPTGLSGSIRRFAFKHSENSYGHWVPLLLADRVNMVEGVIDDLKSGKVPNLFKEMGYVADWKHNRTSLMIKCAVGALAVAWLMRDKDR